ncbi:MAG TPA: LPS assembly lipoprotein LptE [Alphaproteobacteria bacterium]
MMRRVPLAILLASLLGAAGCGFEPLYAQREGRVDVPEQLQKIRIGEISAPVPDVLAEFDYRPENARSSQILRNYLLDDLSPRGIPAQSEYVLNIRLIEPRTNLAIDRSDAVIRYGYSVTASFALNDAGGRTVYSGSTTSSTTFEASTSEFATVSSQRDARDRVMQEISANIRNQLAVFFHGQQRQRAARPDAAAAR